MKSKNNEEIKGVQVLVRLTDLQNFLLPTQNAIFFGKEKPENKGWTLRKEEDLRWRVERCFVKYQSISFLAGRVCDIHSSHM